MCLQLLAVSTSSRQLHSYILILPCVYMYIYAIMSLQMQTAVHIKTFRVMCSLYLILMLVLLLYCRCFLRFVFFSYSCMQEHDRLIEDIFKCRQRGREKVQGSIDSRGCGSWFVNIFGASYKYP